MASTPTGLARRDGQEVASPRREPLPASSGRAIRLVAVAEPMRTRSHPSTATVPRDERGTNVHGPVFFCFRLLRFLTPGSIPASTFPQDYFATRASRCGSPRAGIPIQLFRLEESLLSVCDSLFQHPGKARNLRPEPGDYGPSAAANRVQIARIPCIFPDQQGSEPRRRVCTRPPPPPFSLPVQRLCARPPRPSRKLPCLARSWERGTGESGPETASFGP
jgi:hypothetical protein